jgi:hypothetical protein
MHYAVFEISDFQINCCLTTRMADELFHGESRLTFIQLKTVDLFEIRVLVRGRVEASR